jgi:2-polyprenyl-3-methyl-5-hydroxy-6-metoxy-1,4-benzoquinol methylase
MGTRDTEEQDVVARRDLRMSRALASRQLTPEFPNFPMVDSLHHWNFWCLRRPSHRIRTVKGVGKLAYLRRSFTSQFNSKRFTCPNCGDSRSNVVDRKYLITQLRRCLNCQLMFRTPNDDPALNTSFYESAYSQGFTTELPSDVTLSTLKETNFAGGEKDYSYYIGMLRQLGLQPGARVFDFGCSWGYGSYQLAKSGFLVTSFEVAPTRRRYAREKLGVDTVDDMQRTVKSLAGQFDCFFSAHVLEHVPAPRLTFDYALQLLKENGIFVCFTPNGSDHHRSVSPNWKKLWGEVHPNFIDETFLDQSFGRSPRSVGSSPVKNASIPNDLRLQTLNDLEGGELFFVARKVAYTWA